eukprot:971215-Amphidinium_carterae.1
MQVSLLSRACPLQGRARVQRSTHSLAQRSGPSFCEGSPARADDEWPCTTGKDHGILVEFELAECTYSAQIGTVRSAKRCEC